MSLKLDRVERGNLGDWKRLSDKVGELRLNFGAGYRVYFGNIANTIVLLLAGGDKKTQDKDIREAQLRWKEYLVRKDNENL
ncbi:MAG: type II toxin-antitoxin system RelE/ParE family toxin [Spirochaetales bacterium]|nr:type II toxin-antitoxin system RelE/ParE family toxin [Spirochaetales bacterium]